MLFSFLLVRLRVLARSRIPLCGFACCATQQVYDHGQLPRTQRVAFVIGQRDDPDRDLEAVRGGRFEELRAGVRQRRTGRSVG
jgi:hypothetical protein